MRSVEPPGRHQLLARPRQKTLSDAEIEKAPLDFSGGACLIDLPSAVVAVMMVPTTWTDIQADPGTSAIITTMVMPIGAPMNLFRRRRNARAGEARQA